MKFILTEHFREFLVTINTFKIFGDDIRIKNLLINTFLHMEEKLMAIEKFIESIPVGPLAIVALSGSKALGETVDAYISDWRSERIEAKESPINFQRIM